MACTIEHVGVGRAGLTEDVNVEPGSLPAEMTDDTVSRKPLHRRYQPVAATMHLVNGKPEGIDIGKGVRHRTAGDAQFPSQRLAGMKFSIFKKPENFKRMRSQSSYNIRRGSPALYRKRAGPTCGGKAMTVNTMAANTT